MPRSPTPTLSRRARVSSVAIAALLASASGCAPAPPSVRNVVVVSLDTLGATHASAYGYRRSTTPRLAEVAAEGTLFENAYTPQTWTMSAHLSMMTGLYPRVHGAALRRRASPAAVPLAEILRANGFATAAFMGTGGYAGAAYGLGRGFDVFETGVSDAREDNAGRFAWLEEQARACERDPKHRFFLLAHYFDVHSEFDGELPYSAPERFLRRYFPNGVDWNRRGATDLLWRLDEEGGVTEEDRRILTALYDAGVLYSDEIGLGALLDRLDALGLREETLLVVTSDHGEEIFEHGHALHQQPYEETSRVPLVFRGPGVLAGRRVREIVELVDLAPTILALLGLPIPDSMQGRDLTPTLSAAESIGSGQAHVDGIFGAIPPYLNHQPSQVVREIDGVRWSYVNKVYSQEYGERRMFGVQPGGALYRLDRDPAQQRDVAAEHPELARELEQALLQWYVTNDALARRLGQSKAEDESLGTHERARLRALGYAE